jgi:hypothetical protein
LEEVAEYWGNFMYLWGILGDFQAEIFRGFFDKNLEFLGDFFSLSWQP